MRKILLTGASGFVGTALVNKLLNDNYQIVATTTKDTTDNRMDGGIQWVKWDAQKGDLPHLDYNKIDAVIHLAASMRNPDRIDLFKVVVESTFYLFEHLCLKNIFFRHHFFFVIY